MIKFLLPFLLTTQLQVVENKVVINGREATCYLLEPFGIRLKQGESFDVELKNQLDVPTSIHWHGLILPNNQDGVANVTQFPIYPKNSYRYHFPIKQTGTYWMHAHYNMQEQRLLAAPLIIEDDLDYKDKILFLSDFSFKTPEEIFQSLKCKKMDEMDHADVYDVAYGAYLANGRTLSHAEITEINPSEKLRLRVINASAATNFTIDLGSLKGQAIAIDGHLIEPVSGSSFEVAVSQRLDVLLTFPKEEGAFPILALVEGRPKQAGIILSTKDAKLPKLSENSGEKGPTLANKKEAQFHPLKPLEERPIDRKIDVELGGNMMNYTWTINNQMWPNVTPLIVKEDERVEISFHNTSSMSHPMHLHGHVFQVTELNGEKVNGPIRDTVLVLPHSVLKIQFDADNKGVWPLHCHILYHQEAGMMTVLRYEDFIQPL